MSKGRSGAVPKYRSIYLDIEAKVARGDLRAGEQLPTQHVMADQYGVTIMTLRQALAELETDGIVHAEHGRGTFVSARPFQYRLNNLSSFAQELAQQGESLTTRVQAIVADQEGDSEVRAKLALSPGDRPLLVERLRLIDGRPVLLQRSYVPPDLADAVAAADLERSSLYDVLRVAYGVEVTRAVETLRAVNLTAEEAGPLRRMPGSAALLSMRLSLAEHDRPALFDRALLPGDAAEITAERLPERLQLSYRVR